MMSPAAGLVLKDAVKSLNETDFVNVSPLADEYGNIVPTDDPNRGIPTRARVRFRIGMFDSGGEGRLRARAKFLVPHNPANLTEVDWNFSEKTEDFSFDDMYWNKTITNICENLVRDGGMFLFTCATTGRPEHGTRASTASDSPFTSGTDTWSDYYMNLTEEDVKGMVDLDKYFKIYHFYVGTSSCDLYFWGINKEVKDEKV